MATCSGILAGKCHGQKNLAGYNPWGHRVRYDSSAQNMPRTRFDFNPVHKEKEKKIGRKCIKILKWLCWEGLCKFSLSHINFIVKIWLPNNPVCSLTQPIELMVLNISKAAGSLERVATINKCKVWLWVYFWSAFSKITCLHIATFGAGWGVGRINAVKYLHLWNCPTHSA